MTTFEIPPLPPPSFEAMSFGQRLRYAREFKGMTGLALCKVLGVPSQTLSTWEKGTVPTKPDPFTLCTQLQEISWIPREWFAWGTAPRELPEPTERDNAP